MFIDPVDRVSRIAAEIIYAVGLGIPIFLHIANILKDLRKVSRNIACIT